MSRKHAIYAIIALALAQGCQPAPERTVTTPTPLPTSQPKPMSGAKAQALARHQGPTEPKPKDRIVLPPKGTASRERAAQSTNVFHDVGAIIGKSASQVKKVIGEEGFNVERHEPGDLYGFPDGAVSRDYWTKRGRTGNPAPGATMITVIFDTDGKAKEVSFSLITLSGLTLGNMKYTRDQGPALLRRMGINVNVGPDSEDPNGQNWYDNVPHYHIWMGVDNSGHINGLKIRTREIRQKGERGT